MKNLGWSVDRSVSIGSGGFGQVFNATDPDGKALAAKVVAKSPGVDRDLLAVRLDPSDHVVPIVHIEETDDELILYMPRAEGSLRDRVASGKPIHAHEVLDILQQIAAGLVAIKHQIVHRDLKPENILLLQGKWAICDFGISRYAEASTAADTKKFSMTPPYAAPEQWLHEHATSATDIYAFGVIAHELLSGDRPFPGPGVDSYRDQHLNVAPPKLQTTKRLVSLVQECLFKAPGARPSAENLAARLKSADVDAKKPGASALADAHQVAVETEVAAQKALQEKQTEQSRRKILSEPAALLFEQISEELIEFIQDQAPAAIIRRNYTGRGQVELGSAKLTIAELTNNPVLNSQFDVIAFSSITLTNQQGFSRSHSLYYANFDTESEYKWYELAFCGSMHGANFDNEPKALPPSQGMNAFDRIMGTVQLGRSIVGLDLGDLDQFVDQWAERLGLAAVGKFPRVFQLPEGHPVYPARNGSRF